MGIKHPLIYDHSTSKEVYFMPDMLVKLYELPPMDCEHQKMQTQGITVRPALPAERCFVLEFVNTHFSRGWENETAVALTRLPMGCHIAVKDNHILGFSCWDVVGRGLFGPIGVLPDTRGMGVGRALVLSCMHAMRAYGYGYAVIAWVGPAAFYQKCCGAKIIEGSEPGVFRGMLKEPITS